MSVTQRKRQRVGNSASLALPPEVLEVAGLQRGAEVLVHAGTAQDTPLLGDSDFDELCTLADGVIADHRGALRRLGQ